MQELSLHLLDIVQNSVTAGAKAVEIAIGVDRTADTLSIRIKDDGCGMDAQMLSRVSSPFTTTRTTRKVGLGVPMFRHSAEATGGHFTIQSQVGVGTELCAVYGLSHIDRAPMGDLAGTVLSLIVCNPEMDWRFSITEGAEEYAFDTREVRAVLGDVPLNTPDVVSWMKADIEDGIQSLNGGAL